MYTSNFCAKRFDAGHDYKSWFPIGLGWFDFAIDYFDLLSRDVKDAVGRGKLKILFYYHEGDNPARIKHRLDDLIRHHDLPGDCYHFVSANTAACQLENFSYFPDHEFFFRYINRDQTAPVCDPVHDFTALNRLHKWWRASAMSDLLYRGLLTNSIWSYNTADTVTDELEQDNPIELDRIEGWRDRARQFVEKSPYRCDGLTSHEHNDHHVVNTDLYTKSRCHVVFETLFDVDQSGGAFLTEKTFKAIKYGQPFVIVGGPGSLKALRDMGYRTFDSVIDPSYDSIENTTDRWLAIADLLADLQRNTGWYEACAADVRHNQKIFVQRACAPVNKLLEDLECLQ